MSSSCINGLKSNTHSTNHYLNMDDRDSLCHKASGCWNGEGAVVGKSPVSGLAPRWIEGWLLPGLMSLKLKKKKNTCLLGVCATRLIQINCNDLIRKIWQNAGHDYIWILIKCGTQLKPQLGDSWYNITVMDFYDWLWACNNPVKWDINSTLISKRI